MNKIAVVTGANRGIGFEIVRQLADKGWEVILTARNPEKGELALNEINNERVHFMQLDVTDMNSIELFNKSFRRIYDHLDVLINNAGVFQDRGVTIRTIEESTFDSTMDINLKGPFRLTRALLPLLDKSDDPRVINLSSGLGALSGIGGGYPSYRLSKTALNSLTAIMAADEPHIRINAVCPGWVQTDMGGAGAHRPLSKGAETPVWLATADRAEIPTGKFMRDKKIIDW